MIFIEPENPCRICLRPVIQLADQLHRHNICTDVLLEGGSIQKMMRKANKMGAAYACIIGETEQKDGTVSVKNMVTGKSEVVKQTELANILANVLT